MICKVIIALLTLAAVGTTVIDVTSYRPRGNTVDCDLRVPPGARFCTTPYGDLLFLSDAFFCMSQDGVFDLFFKRCRRGDSRCDQVEDGMTGNLHPFYGPPVTLNDLRFGQFRWRVFPGVGGRDYVLSLPTWAPLALLAAYPVAAFIRGPLRRHQRRRHGLCLKCGYDLTGNISGVCPECGCAWRSDGRQDDGGHRDG